MTEVTGILFSNKIALIQKANSPHMISRDNTANSFFFFISYYFNLYKDKKYRT